MSEILYRGMDQADLDRQLNLRARWPDFEDTFARWARESAKTRANLECRLDLAYGPTPGCRLDFFPGQAGGPLLAFIHGGYWKSLDKDYFSYLAPGFVAAGAGFASLNYDLAPGASIGTMVFQIRQALDWLASEAGALGSDPGRLYLAGHSAGGHLAVQATIPPGPVKGVCSVSGIYDLVPMRLSFHQEDLNIGAEEAETMSPLRQVPAQAPPLICAVGSEETGEFIYQQEALLEAWRAAGLSVRAIDLPGRQHFTAADALGETGHPLHRGVLAMIGDGA